MAATRSSWQIRTFYGKEEAGKKTWSINGKAANKDRNTDILWEERKNTQFIAPTILEYGQIVGDFRKNWLYESTTYLFVLFLYFVLFLLRTSQYIDNQLAARGLTDKLWVICGRNMGESLTNGGCDADKIWAE